MLLQTLNLMLVNSATRQVRSATNSTNDLHTHSIINNQSDNPDNQNESLGSASDYILIAMIVAMMLCMAVCCLCLFCRSSNSFRICGLNFEVGDRNASVAAEDLSELHEVVPLTPTTVGAATHDLPDIENKLRSDPPPPNYSEVINQSNLDTVKRKSKQSGASSNRDKGGSGFSSSTQHSLPRVKSKRSEKRSWSYRSFQRSLSLQPPRLSHNKTNINVPIKEESASEENDVGLVLKSSTAPLHPSASACTSSSLPEKLVIEVTPANGSQTKCDQQDSLSEVACVNPINSNISKEGSSGIGCSKLCSKQASQDTYDDEVFM